MSHVPDRQVRSVKGAFWQPDLAIFRILLGATSMGGDLAELGVLFGRSAILIGEYLRSGETFTVVDLFESTASDEANAEENTYSYASLTRATFEANYLAHHRVLPTIVQGLSSTVLNYASAGTHRFVHVDASHLHSHVRRDIEAARHLLAPDGVLAIDDYRSGHTPGVAAAAWQAVVTSGLRPFAVSPYKMYATWGDDARWRSCLEAWVVTSRYDHETQMVNDRPLLRVFGPAVPATHWLQPYVPPVIWAFARSIRRRRARRRA